LIEEAMKLAEEMGDDSAGDPVVTVG
jgi:hypothetical protein